MNSFVLDSSITMRWFFVLGNHPKADAILRDLMSAACDAIVPILWRYEVSAVLSREVGRNTVPAQETADFIAGLIALPIRVDDESSEHILTDVHRLAITHRLTTYDAAYLELAQCRNLPLATLDAELVAARNAAGVRLV